MPSRLDILSGGGAQISSELGDVAEMEVRLRRSWSEFVGTLIGRSCSVEFAGFLVGMSALNPDVDKAGVEFECGFICLGGQRPSLSIARGIAHADLSVDI